MMPEYRPYFEAVEEFLTEAQQHNVTSLHLVAMCSDPDTHDVVAGWNAGPFETAAAAGVLQLHAAQQYTELNNTDEEEDDDDYG